MLSVLSLNMLVDISNFNQFSNRSGAHPRNHPYLPNSINYSFYLEISTPQLTRMARLAATAMPWNKKYHPIQISLVGMQAIVFVPQLLWKLI
jgi:hypothetical protein